MVTKVQSLIRGERSRLIRNGTRVQVTYYQASGVALCRRRQVGSTREVRWKTDDEQSTCPYNIMCAVILIYFLYQETIHVIY